MKMHKNIAINQCALILAGLPGSGKSHASNILKGIGWKIVSAGDLVRELCIEMGLDTKREILQRVGVELLKKRGDDYFANMLINKANGAQLIVFEGIRPQGVIEYIRKHLKCLIVYIDASDSVRYLRLRERDTISLESFEKLNEHDLERQVNCSFSLADVIIDNNGGLFDYEKTIINLGKDLAQKC